MKATILDLRYRMNDILKAIERNEKVSISYHGKQKGVIISSAGYSAHKVTEHPFFNMRKTVREKSVEQEMSKLRGGRYRDL